MDILKSNLKFICFNTLLPIRHSHIHLCLQNVKANIRGMLQLFKKKKDFLHLFDHKHSKIKIKTALTPFHFLMHILYRYHTF